LSFSSLPLLPIFGRDRITNESYFVKLFIGLHIFNLLSIGVLFGLEKGVLVFLNGAKLSGAD
jgi:hypothetical protein